MEKIVCVLVISGPLKDHKFFVKTDSPILIGRDNDATIKITYDEYCSRRHAIIYWSNNVYFVEDLNSANGTFVNNTRIYGKKELCNKDLIGLGNTKLVVLINDYQKDRTEEKSLKKYAPGRAKMEGKIGVGDFIGDDFDIREVIEGGMGIVYICYNNKNKKMYALKTIKKYDIFNDETTQKENVPSKEMFKQEAYNWINLGKHPYIVRAYTVQRFFAEMSYPSKLYIIMEYVPLDNRGRNTLAHYFNELTYVEILKIAIQFCCGMEYAHSKGIEAHMDIKPNNIMIMPNLTVKITDFGITKSFQMINEKDEKFLEGNLSQLRVFKSASGVICGTPPYMAPEQFNGYADKRSDIYSFGIVLYQLVKGGEFPFLGKTSSEYENLHKYENVPYLKSPLFSIIKQCLEKDPEKRYKDFSVIKEELQELFLKETGERLLLPLPDTNFGYLEWVNKGRALDALHKYEEAICCYDKALEINPKGISAWYWKSVVSVMSEKYKEAIYCYDKILDINPNDIDILRDKGRALSWSSKFPDAIACFDKILEIDPNYDDAWWGKKNALYKLGKYEDAIAWCDKVIDASPNNIKAWSYKADVLFSLGRYEEAVICYNKVLDIQPENSAILADKGKALSKINEYRDAIICYDKALEIDEINVPLLIDKIIVLIDAGQHKNALSCCNEALQINPECGDALYYKAVSLFKLNKFEDALGCVEKILNLDPLQIPKESDKLKQQILQRLRK